METGFLDKHLNFPHKSTARLAPENHMPGKISRSVNLGKIITVKNNLLLI